MRFKNKGIKILNKQGYGDLIVKIKTEAPKSVDKKTKELIKELAEKIPENNYSKYTNYLKKIKD